MATVPPLFSKPLTIALPAGAAATTSAPPAVPQDTSELRTATPPPPAVPVVPSPAPLAAATAVSLLPAPLAAGLHKILDRLIPASLDKYWKFLFGPAALPAEAHPEHGEVYLLQNGQSSVLKAAGQTSLTADDAPPQSVANNRVVIGIEGINGGVDGYTKLFSQLMEQDTPGTVNLNQPMLVVHEGVEKDRAAAMERIGRDFLSMKEVQRGEHVNESKIFKTDPAVQTSYDLVKQQLDRGRDVLMVVHSGGGAESGLALNLLAHDGYADAIHQHVRVISFAGVSSSQDYQHGGVDPNNMLYVGDHRDAVALTGSRFVDPHHPLAGLEAIKQALGQPGTDFSLGTVHGMPNLMHLHHDKIQAFLQGGPGGTFLG